MKKLFAKPKRLPVTATREDEWDSDMPTIKLSTAFMVILFLHVALVGGVMVFRMLDQSPDRAESTADSQTAGPATAGTSASVSSPVESNPTAATADASAETSAAPAPAAPAPDARNDAPLQRHTVRHRESLDDIATRFGVTRQSIVTLNEISETNPFRENMTLLIPEAPRTMRAETPSGLASRSSSAPEVRAARPVDASAAPPRARAVEPAASTTQASTAASSSAAPANHEVQPGETLWAISRRYNVTVNALMQANNISDPSLIQSGTVLRIPSN